MPACRRAWLLGLLLIVPAALHADGKTLVSTEARDRNLRDVIRDLARAAKVQVYIRPEVRGVINTTIRKTPFEQALAVVVATHGFDWKLVKGVYHIGRFSTGAEAGRAVTEVIPLAALPPEELARSFGYLDLASLTAPGPTLDLRALLPAGLTTPPRPVEKGLEVTGSAAAVADLKHLISQLEETSARVSVKLLVVELPVSGLDDLPVSWAKGPMNVAGSPGRDAVMSSGGFGLLAGRLKGAAEARLLAECELPLPGLGSAEAAVGNGRVRLAARVEPGLGLKVWLAANLPGEPETVELTANGALLPPEEGLLLAARPQPGAPGAALAILLLPTVTPR